MSQPTYAAPTARTLLRAVRRSLVLLGGAFVVWLLLGSGAAHADSQESHGSAAVGQVLHHARSTAPAPQQHRAAGLVNRTLHRATAPVTHALRSAPERATTTVTGLVARTPLRSTITRLTDAVEPALTRTTTALADTTDQTVDAVGGAIDPPTSDTSSTTSSTPTASTSAAMTDTKPAKRSTHPRSRTVTAITAPPHVAQHASTATATGATDPSGHPASDTPITPTSPSGGSSGGSALLSGLILIAPGLTPRRRHRDDDTPATGPAYDPGSSPD